MGVQMQRTTLPVERDQMPAVRVHAGQAGRCSARASGRPIWRARYRALTGP